MCSRNCIYILFASVCFPLNVASILVFVLGLLFKLRSQEKVEVKSLTGGRKGELIIEDLLTHGLYGSSLL